MIGGPWYDPYWYGYGYYGYPYPYYYGAYGYPYYGYPYGAYGAYGAYPPDADAYPSYSDDSEYVQQEPPPDNGQYPAGYWYYCASSKGYYPTVQQCPEEWVKVPPAPQ